MWKCRQKGGMGRGSMLMEKTEFCLDSWKEGSGDMAPCWGERRAAEEGLRLTCREMSAELEGGKQLGVGGMENRGPITHP